MSNEDSGQNYDQVVYYVAPAVLVAAILFCCFRMALVYYMQIRPRRNQNSASVQVTPRETELQTASGAFPRGYRDLFLQVPFPPNYEQTIKNDRRSMSAIEIGTTSTSHPTAIEIIAPTQDLPESSLSPNRSHQSTRDALRRVQSNVEHVEQTPPENLGPPAYQRRLSIEVVDSGLLSPEHSIEAYSRDRLPSYEQAISQPESRRPTLLDV